MTLGMQPASSGLGLGKCRRMPLRPSMVRSAPWGSRHGGLTRGPLRLAPRASGAAWLPREPANESASDADDSGFGDGLGDVDSGRHDWEDDDQGSPPDRLIFDRAPREKVRELLTRLNENDVEYNELKHVCKDNGLGGKDNRHNLRAKLIRETRRQLGLPVWDKRSYKLHKGGRVQRPSDMSAGDLERFFRERQVLLPKDREEAVGLAFAMLVADGVLAPDEVPAPSPYDRYPHKELATLCAVRNLPLKGTKAELQARLQQYDLQRWRAKLAERAQRAAEQEKGAASIHEPPRPPNRELARDLAEAQETAVAMAGMELLDLRLALLARRLPIYGTKEVLVDRLREVLRRDVKAAHAGEGRMEQYARAAVGKLAPQELSQALAERGMAGSYDDAAETLVKDLVEEWVDLALSARAAAPFGDDDGGEKYSGAEQYEASAAASGEGRQLPGDPTLEVLLVCDGLTQSQRDAALASARAALPHLQSDPFWGTLPSYQRAAPGGGGAPPLAPAERPPAAPLDVVDTFVNPNAVAVELDRAARVPGAVFTVTATPVDGTGAEVTAEAAGPDVTLTGLTPGATYQLVARLRNAAGYGPPGEPFLVMAPQRAGVAVKVVYPARGGGEGGGGRRYVQLAWEDLHACSAAELDARLGGQDPSALGEAAELAQWASADTVVLPLGLAPGGVGGGGEGGACVGGMCASETLALEASRPAFTRAASRLGYAAPQLLELSAAELDGAGAASTVASWLAAQGLDPALTRVAARVEAGGEVLLAGLGRGVEQVAAGAAGVLAAPGALGAASVVLEAVPPGGVHFCCSVVATEAGAVALPLTELDYYDLDEEIDASELEFERHWLLREGKEEAGVDALIAQWREERRAHPALLDDAASRTQQLRHSTPPAALPPAVAEGVRHAAAKLFADLRLRDFAQFRGWVAPEAPSEALQLAARLLDPAAAGGSAKPSERPPPPAPRPFAELQRLDEEERAQRAQQDAARYPFVVAPPAGEPAASLDSEVFGRLADEKDADAALASMPLLGRQGAPVGQFQVRYGEFAGIPVGVDKTRAQLLAEMEWAEVPAIPDEEPQVEVPDALPDLSAASPRDLCHVDGRVIRFNQVSLVPELGDGSSPLAQQAAAAGLSLAVLARQLVSRAARRAGLPGLPPLRECDAHAEEEGGELPLFAVAERAEVGAGGGAAAAPASLEEIGAALAAWAAPPPLPPPESYEDILAEGSDGEGGGEVRQGAAGAGAGAGLARGVRAGSTAAEPDDDTGDAGWLPATSTRGHPLYDDPLSEDDDADALHGDADPAALLASQFPGLHPTRQRVWVLCGGEGPLRDAGLRGALHAVASLQAERDLLVEAFMMDPPDAGARHEEGRRVLLRRRLDLRCIGATDEELLAEFPEFHPTRIKHLAPHPPEDLDWRGVWRLAGTPVVRPEVADTLRGVEAALREATAPQRSRVPGDRWHVKQQLLATARGELAAAGVATGGGGPWGGSLAAPEPPYYCFLEEWVEAAAQQCAVVLLALPSHPAADGALQRLLEARGVPFTGCSSVSADQCTDRPELMRRLAEWYDYQGFRARMDWHHTISLPELAATCDTETSADNVFAQLSAAAAAAVAGGRETLVVRPAREAGGLGVMRAGCGQDLRLYAHAAQQWWDVLPEEALSVEEDDVQMPVPPPTQYIVEALAEGHPLQLWTDDHGAPLPPPPDAESPAVATSTSAASGALGAAPDSSTGAEAFQRFLHWPRDENPWLEVRSCLLGGAGTSQCLGLTVAVQQLRRLPDGCDIEVARFDLTPPPPAILHPAAAETVQLRITDVADHLGIFGAAQVRALVHPDTGDTVVLDVDPHPDFTPGSLLLRQAALRGQTATEVLRELLKVAMSRGEEAVSETFEGLRIDSASIYPEDEYAAATAAQAGAEVEVPSPESTYYGNPYMVVEDDAGEEREAPGAEEEEEEGWEGAGERRVARGASFGQRAALAEEGSEGEAYPEEGLLAEDEGQEALDEDDEHGMPAVAWGGLGGQASLREDWSVAPEELIPQDSDGDMVDLPEL